jgi:hypothetical protein
VLAPAGGRGSRARGKSWEIDCREVAGYWLGHFPTLGEKTRGSIVAMFSTLAESLMRGKMRELFCEGCSLSPEDVLAGKIVVVDLPVKEWSEVGRMAAVLWKYCLQKAVERRTDNGERPGTAPLPLGRRVPAFRQPLRPAVPGDRPLLPRGERLPDAELPEPDRGRSAGSRAGKAMTDSLLGNMGTKIFHANSDRETNQLAADLVGKRLQSLRHFGSGASLSLGGQASAGSSANRGRSEHMDYEMQPMEFSTLGKGGADNCAPEALVFQNGRLWGRTGRTWQKVSFRQRPGRIEAPPPQHAHGARARTR